MSSSEEQHRNKCFSHPSHKPTVLAASVGLQSMLSFLVAALLVCCIAPVDGGYAVALVLVAAQDDEVGYRSVKLKALI